MHQILVSRYFREELKQRISGKGLSREGPIAAVPNLFGTRDRFHGRQFFQGTGLGGWGRGDGSHGNASDGE